MGQLHPLWRYPIGGPTPPIVEVSYRWPTPPLWRYPTGGPTPHIVEVSYRWANITHCGGILKVGQHHHCLGILQVGQHHPLWRYPTGGPTPPIVEVSYRWANTTIVEASYRWANHSKIHLDAPETACVSSPEVLDFKHLRECDDNALLPYCPLAPVAALGLHICTSRGSEDVHKNVVT